MTDLVGHIIGFEAGDLRPPGVPKPCVKCGAPIPAPELVGPERCTGCADPS